MHSSGLPPVFNLLFTAHVFTSISLQLVFPCLQMSCQYVNLLPNYLAGLLANTTIEIYSRSKISDRNNSHSVQLNMSGGCSHTSSLLQESKSSAPDPEEQVNNPDPEERPYNPHSVEQLNTPHLTFSAWNASSPVVGSSAHHAPCHVPHHLKHRKRYNNQPPTTKVHGLMCIKLKAFFVPSESYWKLEEPQERSLRE